MVSFKYAVLELLSAPAISPFLRGGAKFLHPFEWSAMYIVQLFRVVANSKTVAKRLTCNPCLHRAANCASCFQHVTPGTNFLHECCQDSHQSGLVPPPRSIHYLGRRQPVVDVYHILCKSSITDQGNVFITLMIELRFHRNIVTFAILSSFDTNKSKWVNFTSEASRSLFLTLLVRLLHVFYSIFL